MSSNSDSSHRIDPYSTSPSFSAKASDHFFRLIGTIQQRYRFVSALKLRNTINRLHDDLLTNKTRDQYALFHSLPLDSCLSISESLSNELKFERFNLFHTIGVLVIRIKPSSYHERAITEINKIINTELADIDTDERFVAEGASNTRLENWYKEPDAAFSAREFNELGASLVIEVGMAESMNRLIIDADGWLQNSPFLTVLQSISTRMTAV
ncbi:uncharacterized protein N7483_011207 [Penicillium malachiteum]|uniref:uncharacterized protein n=1 Tax=Penicillium malachiteum TaxID=1324776 RepID=UPI00254820AA|nr:uncharacterized protein N7483_011207 [Penicillium malachiteum]KAJ5714026.1 hypothetical protein N7483_011207 [Penicillium malachiteum]